MIAHINGSKLFYQIHGGLGLDHNYFRPWFDVLGDNIQLIYYDHRGNGCSEMTDGFEGITHETFADDAEQLRHHLGCDRIFLLGHSYGGFLAIEYALRYPNKLHVLILCNTAPVLDYPEVVQAKAAAWNHANTK